MEAEIGTTAAARADAAAYFLSASAAAAANPAATLCLPLLIHPSLPFRVLARCPWRSRRLFLHLFPPYAGTQSLSAPC